MAKANVITAESFLGRVQYKLVASRMVQVTDTNVITRYMPRTEVASLLRNLKRSKRAVATVHYEGRPGINEFTAVLSDSVVEIGCQRFDAAAVKTVTRWALARKKTATKKKAKKATKKATRKARAA